MFLKIFNKLYSYNLLYNILIASLCAISERIIRTVFATNTLDSIMITNNQTAPVYRLLLLITLRYIFASHRHIYAYKAGYNAKYTLVQYYYSLIMSNSKIIDHQEIKLVLKDTVNRITGLISRIAIDFIPGIISIIIGCYNCLNLSDINTGIYGIVYVLFIEILYYNLNNKYSNQENRLETLQIFAENSLFVRIFETISKYTNVLIFDKVSFECVRLENECKSVYKDNISLIKLSNYLSCFLRWLGHLINGGMILIYRGKIPSQHILILLYNVNEIRSGINELKIYYKYYIVSRNLINKLDLHILPKKHNNNIVANIVNLQNINLSFNKHVIYKNLNFRFYENTIYILTGPNGSGKSTLFKLLMGIYLPHQGIIYSPYPSDILVCDQTPQIFNTESVLFNISYGCNKIINTDKELSPAVKKAIDLLDIGYLLNLDIRSLSGGEKQKISLARVIARAFEKRDKIKLLLLDEHDNALDYKSKKNAMIAINYIQKITRCTIIIISHNQNYIEYHNYQKLSIIDHKIIIKNIN